MKSAETSLSAHVLKKMRPEEFDLVILGGGTGSTREATSVHRNTKGGFGGWPTSARV